MYYSKIGTEGYSAQINEVLSINELHRHLGHVSHDRVKLLVGKGLVEGVELMPDEEATICESCESAKGVRKSVVKVRDVLLLVTKYIPICGDQHQSSRSTIKVTM